MLRYFKKYYENGRKVEMSHDEALRYLLDNFLDNDMTRDLLKVVNRIPMRYAEMLVDDYKEDGSVVSLEGEVACMMLPEGAVYDDDRRRING